MNEQLICPDCDSEDIKEIKIREADVLPFDSKLEYEAVIHECQECGEKGSFSSEVTEENHKKYYLAQKEANQQSMDSIIQHLDGLGNSMAHIERSLGLAQRTLSRWKSSGVSASGMALMRVVRTYPWILNVADENYDEQFSRDELVRQFAHVFHGYLQEKNIQSEFSRESTGDGLPMVVATFTPENPTQVSTSEEVLGTSSVEVIETRA